MEDKKVYIDELKGIKILYEGDFYEFAKVVIKMMGAYDKLKPKQVNTTSVTRPTVYGMARKFASTVNIYFPDEYVLDILKERGFSGREVLYMDDL